jgi:hypothetical protein
MVVIDDIDGFGWRVVEHWLVGALRSGRPRYKYCRRES